MFATYCKLCVLTCTFHSCYRQLVFSSSQRAGAAEQQLDALRLAALGLITAACSWEAFRTTRSPVTEASGQQDSHRCPTRLQSLHFSAFCGYTMQ